MLSKKDYKDLHYEIDARILWISKPVSVLGYLKLDIADWTNAPPLYSQVYSFKEIEIFYKQGVHLIHSKTR